MTTKGLKTLERKSTIEEYAATQMFMRMIARDVNVTVGNDKKFVYTAFQLENLAN